MATTYNITHGLPPEGITTTTHYAIDHLPISGSLPSGFTYPRDLSKYLGIVFNKTPGESSEFQYDLDSSTLNSNCVRSWDYGVDGYYTFNWASIENSVGVWRWDIGDPSLCEKWVDTHGTTRNRDLLITLAYCAPDAEKYPNSPSGAYGTGTGSVPTDMERWRQYCRFVAHKCKGRVKFFEVLNEPTLGASLTLDADITSGATSATVRRHAIPWPTHWGLVNPLTASPTSGTVDVLVDDEVIEFQFGSYNGSPGTGSYTITRARQGSSAAAHTLGTKLESEMSGFYAGRLKSAVTMVRIANEEIKKINPGAKILSPCLAGSEVAVWNLRSFLECHDGVVFGRDVVDVLAIHETSCNKQFSGNAMVLNDTALNGLRAIAGLAKDYGKPWWHTEYSLYKTDKDHTLFSSTERSNYLRKMLCLPLAFGCEKVFFYGYAFGTNDNMAIVYPRDTGATWDLRSAWNTLYADLTAGNLIEPPTISGNNVILKIGSGTVTV